MRKLLLILLLFPVICFAENLDKTDADSIGGITVDTSGITTDQILKYNGTSFVPTTDTGGEGITTANADIRYIQQDGSGTLNTLVVTNSMTFGEGETLLTISNNYIEVSSLNVVNHSVVNTVSGNTATFTTIYGDGSNITGISAGTVTDSYNNPVTFNSSLAIPSGTTASFNALSVLTLDGQVLTINISEGAYGVPGFGKGTLPTWFSLGGSGVPASDVLRFYGSTDMFIRFIGAANKVFGFKAGNSNANDGEFAYHATSDYWYFKVAGTQELNLYNDRLEPQTTLGLDLGSSTKYFANGYVATMNISNYAIGEMYVSYNTVEVNIATQDVYYTITTNVMEGITKNVTFFNDGTDCYFTIIVPGVYDIALSMSFLDGNNILYHGGISLNDANPAGNFEWSRKLNASGDVGSVSSGGFVTLAVGDKIRVKIENNDDDSNPTVRYMSCRIRYVGF